MSESGAVVEGHCEPAFGSVRDALAEVLASGFEVGAALAVYVDGDAAVDLWGGSAEAARTRPWQRDTSVNLYSVGKAIGAVCVLRLVDAGLLALNEPVARYWPEFAQAGKARLPVRYLLTHQAALPAIGPAVALGRVELMGHDRRGARGAGALVGAGCRSRVSRQHAGLSGRRARATRYRA